MTRSTYRTSFSRSPDYISPFIRKFRNVRQTGTLSGSFFDAIGMSEAICVAPGFRNFFRWHVCMYSLSRVNTSRSFGGMNGINGMSSHRVWLDIPLCGSNRWATVTHSCSTVFYQMPFYKDVVFSIIETISLAISLLLSKASVVPDYWIYLLNTDSPGVTGRLVFPIGFLTPMEPLHYWLRG